MSNLSVVKNSAPYSLPPLILHPFADQGSPNKLLESSRASLALQGLLPAGDSTRDDLDRTLLEGRFSELRMLYYVGKDLVRWIEQCEEFVERHRAEVPPGIRFQSFAALLVDGAPVAIQEKLRKWGVTDYKSIFARALGLNSLFAKVPEYHQLSGEFIRNYHRYADQLFSCRQTQTTFTPISARDFHFELYSSGEYSRMLEKAWEA